MLKHKTKIRDAELDQGIAFFDKAIQRPWILDPVLLNALIDHYSVELNLSKSKGERRDLLEALYDYLEEVRGVRIKGTRESWFARQSKRLTAIIQKLDLGT